MNLDSPLLLEKNLDEGKVLLFTSTLHSEWTTMPAHPPFLVLMWDVCRYLAARPSGRRNLFVGDLIQFDLPVEQYQPPFVLEADTANSVSAELCALMPGVVRAAGRTVRFETGSFEDLFRCVLAWTYLGAHDAPQYKL